MNHLGLFCGIGGFEEACRRAGANLIAMCEIDPQAQRVLRRHFLGVEIITDVKTITKDTFGGIPIDIITGGFPCQDLSVAGRRKGLAGERSGLWFEFIRIIGLYQPRWVVVENVPGLLSGCGCFSCQTVGSLIRAHARIRKRKGGSTCAVCVAGRRMLESHSGRNLSIILQGLAERGYCVAWRVFDSQYDGVAQRRKRVFIVASFGNASCAEVLFEREGSAWDSPPSRDAGEGVANTLTRGSGKSCGPKNGHGHPLNLISGFGLVGHGEYSSQPATLRAEGGDCGGGSEHLIAFGGNNQSGPIDVATTCNAHGGTGRHDFESETFLVQPQIAHALTSEGADASEDGTGRGTPIVATASFKKRSGFGWSQSDEVTGTLESEGGAHQGGPERVPLVAQTITAHQFRSNGATAGNNGKPANLQVVAFAERTRAEGRNLETQDELAYALTNPGSGGRAHSRQIAGSFGVRRLTPRECERLQGYPDDWTRWGDDGREISDSARYRMLGNAVCLPTVEWIAQRIKKFQE